MRDGKVLRDRPLSRAGRGAAIDTRRVILAPSDLAVIAASGAPSSSAEVPETVALGRAEGVTPLL